MLPIGVVVISEILPFVLGGIALFIPIVYLLTHHQRKMAELVRGDKKQEALPEVIDELRQMRAELQQLRTEQHETAIAVDELRTSVSDSRQSSAGVETRLHGQ